MNLVHCRNTGYCEPFRCGMFEDLNACSYSAPWYIQSTHLQWPTPPGELKLLFFTESLLHLNVLCAVLGILLLVIRLCCGNSSLKVNFLLNEWSYGHGQDLRNDVQKKTPNYLAVIFSWTSELQECQSHPNKMSLLFPQQNDIQFLSWGCRTFMKGNRKYREWEKREKRRDIDKPILNSQCALLL